MTWSRKIQIGSKYVGDGYPSFIIAEIGSNHDQDLAQALALIDVAADSGADAVKFQSLKLDEVHRQGDVSKDFKEFFKRIELSESWYGSLMQHCKKRNVEFLSSVTYFKAIKILTDLPAAAIKIASAQFGIHPWLVGQAARAGLPLVVSTGLATFSEIADQLQVIEDSGNERLILLHCISQYPTPIDRVNLRVMKRYEQAFGCLVGFSDHTRSILLPSIAVAQGAAVIEKHITLDRNLPGPDHHFALEPEEFTEMVDFIRVAESALGTDQRFEFSPEEEGYRKNFVYKCVSAESIKKGSDLVALEQEARRAEGGIDVRLSGLLKREFVAARDINPGELICWADVTPK